MVLFLTIVAVVLIIVAIYLFTRKKGSRLPQKIEDKQTPPPATPPI